LAQQQNSIPQGKRLRVLGPWFIPFDQFLNEHSFLPKAGQQVKINVAGQPGFTPALHANPPMTHAHQL
jgi:hypothetical protein